MSKSEALKIVGRAQPRVDGEEKVTGKALYTVDVELPGMTYGKILRSPFPHARLVEVDARKAKRLPGVITVFTSGPMNFSSTARLFSSKREPPRP